MGIVKPLNGRCFINQIIYDEIPINSAVL